MLFFNELGAIFPSELHSVFYRTETVAIFERKSKLIKK